MDINTMFQQIEDYWWLMAGKGRLIRIDEGRTGLCTFFVLNDIDDAEKYHTRPIWSIPDDDPEGSIIYIDKIFAKKFDKSLFLAIEREITDHFPWWEVAVWYRPGRDIDRCYTHYRRVPHGANV